MTIQLNNIGKKINFEQFVAKAKLVHGDIFSYTKMILVDGVLSKVPIECKIHGIFLKRVFSHLNGEGCPKCVHASHQKSFQEIIERANKVHDCLYDYSLIPPNVKYTKDKVDIICKEHGVFNQSLKNHILHKTKCPMCSKKARSMERHPKQQQWNNNTIEL